MNVQVLNIQSRKQEHLFDIQALVDGERHTLNIKVEEKKGDSFNIQVACGDKYSRSVLQHNARIMGQIDRLVLKVYNGQEVALPVTITEYLSDRLMQTRKTDVNGHQTYFPSGLELITRQPILQTA